MTASNVTRETLEDAAAEVGIRVEVDTLSGSGRRHRVKAYPVVGTESYTAGGHRRKGEKGDARWQRTSAGWGHVGERRVHAVCWHGFRAFFRAVYRREPNAIFRTAAATYKGSEHFEAVHPATAYRNIGCAFQPVSMAEACRCEEGY